LCCVTVEVRVGGSVAVFLLANSMECRCRWQRGLSRGSSAVRLLELRVRIPPGA
jgi:hypothetical protein